MLVLALVVRNSSLSGLPTRVFGVIWTVIGWVPSWPRVLKVLRLLVGGDTWLVLTDSFLGSWVRLERLLCYVLRMNISCVECVFGSDRVVGLMVCADVRALLIGSVCVVSVPSGAQWKVLLCVFG